MQPEENNSPAVDSVSTQDKSAINQGETKTSYSDNDTRDVSANVTYAAKFRSDAIDDDYSEREISEVEAAPLQTVKWQAKEYISPDKNTVWYIGLGLIVVAVILLDIIYVHSYTLTALILAIATVLIVMSVRPARIIDYTLTDEGLYIGEALIDLNEYKAFGIIHDGKENSILLLPIKRFKPGLSVYFPVESGESIVDNLGQRLPMQEIRLDFIDSIVRLLRL